MPSVYSSNLFGTRSGLTKKDRSKTISSVSRNVVENCLKQILPTDGVIDGDWHFDFREDHVRAYAAFDCIDIEGNHIEWLPFCIKINFDFSYEIGFRGSQSPHVEAARICLEELIGSSLEEERARMWATSLMKDHPKVLADVMEELFKLN